MKSTTIFVGALVAGAALLPAGAAAKAKPKPSEKVIKSVLTTAYCSPHTAPNGNVVEKVKTKLEKVKRSKAREGNIVREGVPEGTTVYPIKLTFVCDYKPTAQANPGTTSTDIRWNGSFIFYKDEAGDWVQRNSGATSKRIS